ncbi:P-loop containing nucleoside triphosphate hydrolase protein [Aspergillus avenaceus]|uniref:RNA helicase n=1 Tax=Aspergillus avenaceus TaxID=36643 RepID=A0A5N6TIC2_ASPAV|nr:P-loop containing nucleoside triphosphate hydrolase protein [Aspergillus avenaceus]
MNGVPINRMDINDFHSSPMLDVATNSETYQDQCGALPCGRDYDGFGRALLQQPKSTLQTHFIRNGLMRLATRFLDLDKGEVECSLDCTIKITSKTITTYGRGSSKAVAEKQALLSLISRLHVAGLLNDLRKGLQYQKISVDDDMSIIMLKALGDLRHIDSCFPTTKRTGLRSEKTDLVSRQNSTQQQNKVKQLPEDMLQLHRDQLPIGKRKDHVLSLVNKNTYSLISAATGSGKSTQVPQILLEDAMAKDPGGECNILCIQPRRIATLSLARRVARERGEALGYSVGYQMRFDSRPPTTSNSITYCTTGFLLNLVQSASYLDAFSYILLDEVHERALDLDLLMLFLKKHVENCRASGTRVPKIVSMSATLDVALFSSYFQNVSDEGRRLPAPHMYVPGRAFPVDKHYLDGIIESLSKTYSPETLSVIIHEPQTEKYFRRYNLSAIEDPRPEEACEVDQRSNDQIMSSSTSSIVREEDPIIPLGLISAVICHILSTTKQGSILVFLPGLRQILNVETAIRKYGAMLGCDFSNESRYKILQLHSSLPEGQKELFSPVPPDCRRIILSTDVAETSVTIPDVRFVVDPGKVNQKLYEPRSRTTRFACCWVSQSSASQRAGRAGRVQEGEYFALYTKEMYKAFRITKLPGMVREDLQKTALQVKRSASVTSIQETLRESIEPPEQANVDVAVKDLQILRALDEREELTALGEHLSEMPLDPCRAKLVLMGIVFRCLDPLLILGALEGDRSLFFLTTDTDTRRKVQKHRVEFAQDTWCDHLSMINALKAIREVWYRTGRANAFKFAVSKGIHFDRVSEIFQSARQTLEYLAKKKLIPAQGRSNESFEFGGADMNFNSWRVPLIKALIYHTLYPNLAAPSSGSPRRYCTETHDIAHMAMSSVNASSYPRSLFLFNSTHRPSGGATYFLQQTTHVTPLVACLLGGRLQGSGHELRMDSWLNFLVQGSGAVNGDRAARVIIELQKVLQSVC